MVELIEFAGYFIGFWLFIFSKRFREGLIRKFKEGNLFKKTVIVFEVVSSIFVSVILPAILIYYAIIES